MILSLEVPDAHLAGALKIAFDGAIAYWCSGIRVLPSHTIYDPKTIPSDMTRFFDPLYGGKWILVDSVTGNRVVLNQAGLTHGLREIGLHHHRSLSSLLDCCFDERAADELVQCAVFGKLTYVSVVRKEALVPVVYCDVCRRAPCACQARRHISTRETLRP